MYNDRDKPVSGKRIVNAFLDAFIKRFKTLNVLRTIPDEPYPFRNFIAISYEPECHVGVYLNDFQAFFRVVVDQDSINEMFQSDYKCCYKIEVKKATSTWGARVDGDGILRSNASYHDDDYLEDEVDRAVEGLFNYKTREHIIYLTKDCQRIRCAPSDDWLLALERGQIPDNAIAKVRGFSNDDALRRFAYAGSRDDRFIEMCGLTPNPDFVSSLKLSKPLSSS